MPYNLTDKRDFFEKDLKYSIGQGLGNAFSKAVDVVIAMGTDGKTRMQVVEDVIALRDMFFLENQNKMEQEIEDKLNMNPIMEWYKEQQEKDEQMKEAQENIIDVGVEI